MSFVYFAYPKSEFRAIGLYNQEKNLRASIRWTLRGGRELAKSALELVSPSHKGRDHFSCHEIRRLAEKAVTGANAKMWLLSATFPLRLRKIK